MPNVRFTLPSKKDPRRTQPNTRQQYLPENVITAQPSSNGLTKRLMKWRKQKDYQLIDSSTRERHYRNGFVSFSFLLPVIVHLHNHFCVQRESAKSVKCLEYGSEQVLYNFENHKKKLIHQI